HPLHDALPSSITQEQADGKLAEWLKDKEAKIAAKTEKLTQSKEAASKARRDAEVKVKEARAEAIRKKSVVPEEPAAEAVEEAPAEAADQVEPTGQLENPDADTNSAAS